VPVVFAPWIGIALGACFAWVAAPELERDGGPLITSRAFMLVAAFAAFVWLPVVGYFLAFHGDWSYLYLVPWRQVPSALDLLFALAAAGTIPASFAISVHPMRKRRTAAVLVAMGAPIVTVLAALPFAARRLAVTGSYAQFHGDFGTEPVPGSLLGKGVLAMALLLAVALVWTLRALMRLSSDAER